MFNMVSDNYVRYQKLKRLLLDVNEVLLDRAKSVSEFQENADLSESIFLWDTLKLITFVESKGNKFQCNDLGMIKPMLQLLEKKKDQISSDKYEHYYEKIMDLFHHFSITRTIKSKFFGPSPDYDEYVWPGEDVLRKIYGCAHFSQVIETFFGPEWISVQDKIAGYINEKINEPEFQHPAVQIMIKAAKTQKEMHGDGMKFVIIVCAALLQWANFLLFRLSPQEIVIGYKLALEKSLKFLDALICCQKDDCKFIPGAGAAEIGLAFKLESLLEKDIPCRSPEGMCIDRFSQALLQIPSTLLENVGLYPRDIINKIKTEHGKGNNYLGFDIKGDNIDVDTLKNQILDNYQIKCSAIELAANAACDIIKDFKVGEKPWK